MQWLALFNDTSAIVVRHKLTNTYPTSDVPVTQFQQNTANDYLFKIFTPDLVSNILTNDNPQNSTVFEDFQFAV